MEELGVPVAFLLSQAEHRMARRLEPLLAAHDCSLERWRVLCGLASHGPQRGHPMSDVATFATLPAPSATKLIDGMVADNLVYRRVDVHDRRRVLIFPTPHGRALHRRLSLAIEEQQQQLVERVSPDGGDGLAVLLGRLIAHLDAEQDPGRVQARCK
ncbi:MarR family winged helix-turn-helix transcriptional regulator [Modestobacter sp. DSM 44400]|uniref:MarR family winged helix-turn-helix transcriptional regulator n=1 Tax=Modestobacter sp. DSM 44400 TaxID=1550230 RepID=UPI001C313DAE|nr:MarR family transcriptional regulator [Modestobacter sp. DSM 44400]